MRHIVFILSIFFSINAFAQLGANEQIKNYLDQTKGVKYKRVLHKNDDGTADGYYYNKSTKEFFCCQKVKDGWVKKFIFVNNELRYVAYFPNKKKKTITKGGMYVFENGVLTAIEEQGIEPFRPESLLEEGKAILEKSVTLQPGKK